MDNIFFIQWNAGNNDGPFSVYLSGSSGLTFYADFLSADDFVAGYPIVVPTASLSSSVVIMNDSFGCANIDIVPFPSITPTVTPTVSVTPSVTPTISVTPTKTPSITATPSVTPSETPAPSVTPTVTPTRTPSFSSGVSVSPTPSITISRTPSITPSRSIFLWMGKNTSTLGTMATTGPNACVIKEVTQAYYTQSGTLSPGLILYRDSAFTIPVTNGPNGYWVALSYNGTGPFISVQINNTNGAIMATYNCP